MEIYNVGWRIAEHIWITDHRCKNVSFLKFWVARSVGRKLDLSNIRHFSRSINTFCSFEIYIRRMCGQSQDAGHASHSCALLVRVLVGLIIPMCIIICMKTAFVLIREPNLSVDFVVICA